MTGLVFQVIWPINFSDNKTAHSINCLHGFILDMRFQAEDTEIAMIGTRAINNLTLSLGYE